MKHRFAVAVVWLSFVLAGCGYDDDSSTPPPKPRAGPSAKTPPSNSKFADAKVAHILIAVDGKGSRQPKVTRTKAQALELAKSILMDVKVRGADFLERAAKFSDDVDASNKPNTNAGEPGVYQGTLIDQFDSAWKDAALKTPVGEVAPEPVESGAFGYFLIKRIK